MMKQYSIAVPIHFNVNKKKRVLVGDNFTRNAHFQVLNKIKQYYKDLVIMDLGGEVMLRRPIHIKMDVYIHKQDVDGPNFGFVRKAVIDGFVEAGIILDDNFKILKSCSENYYLDAEFPRAVFTISEGKRDQLILI